MPTTITAATARRFQYSRKPSAPTTLDDLLYRFQNAPEVKDTGEESRRQIKRAVGTILDRFGKKLLIAEVERPTFRAAVYEWRDEMADRHAACERTIQILSRVLSFGVDRRYVKENQAQGIRFRWQKSTRADIIWTPGQIVDLRSHLGEIRDACEIALWTGIRQVDLLTLHKSQVCRDQQWLTFTPRKTLRQTGVTTALPYALIPPLRAVVNRLLTAENDSPYLLGCEWNDRAFRRVFEAARTAAGLDELEDHELHFHDLRGTLITWLYEASCTDAEVASISGHALAQGNAKNYVARTMALATTAYTKLRTYLDEKHDDWYCDTI